jgi:hypothetical protein
MDVVNNGDLWKYDLANFWAKTEREGYQDMVHVLIGIRSMTCPQAALCVYLRLIHGMHMQAFHAQEYTLCALPRYQVMYITGKIRILTYSQWKLT